MRYTMVSAQMFHQFQMVQNRSLKWCLKLPTLTFIVYVNEVCATHFAKYNTVLCLILWLKGLVEAMLRAHARWYIYFCICYLLPE